MSQIKLSMAVAASISFVTWGTGLRSARADLVTFYGPVPYLSAADIPPGFYSGTPVIETFEDGNLSFGITANTGGVEFPGIFTDSVDGDDGVINGSGSAGHSWYQNSGGPTGLIFAFNGTLPTAAGMVWTDGEGTVTFEAFGAGMVSLGTIGPLNVPIGNHNGSTAEDRFYGVQYGGGIKAIKLSNSSGGIEVDHVQFQSAPIATPEPSSLLLMALAGGPLYLRRHRRTARPSLRVR